jgi:hypothetical protein
LEAESAVNALRAEFGLETSGLQLIKPGDPLIDRKLEPDSRGILATLIRAHLFFGCVGFIIGFLLSLTLIALGLQPFISSPALSIGAITGFLAIAGLLVGGFFSLRPDRDPIIQKAKNATDAGHWFLIIHTRLPEQRQRALVVLNQFSQNARQTM